MMCFDLFLSDYTEQYRQIDALQLDCQGLWLPCNAETVIEIPKTEHKLKKLQEAQERLTEHQMMRAAQRKAITSPCPD